MDEKYLEPVIMTEYIVEVLGEIPRRLLATTILKGITAIGR